MRTRTLILPLVSLLLSITANAFDGSQTIVQSGSLSAGGAPTTQEVVLAQFDDEGGTLVLESVELSVLTSTIAGCQTNGSGIPTHVHAELDAVFFFGTRRLVTTEAVIDATLANTGPPVALTFFDNDQGSVTIAGAAGLAPFVGDGRVRLGAFTQFQVSEDPPQSVFFGAGGGVQWTVTYRYRQAGP
jgi:hypothetical protein